MKKTGLLFLIILIEGYVVLACELLAIRQLVPFVGSGTEIVAIIISGVLLPLALGYETGGKAFKRAHIKAKAKHHKLLSIRTILRDNILKAVLILGAGLSYPFLELFFGLLTALGITHRLPQTVIYVLLFLVTPVFLLGQTVPLVSNYFSRRRLSEITGKMLFFSTTGSFLGSIFSTIVLMTTIGVHNTVIVTIGLLSVLCLLLSGKRPTFEALLCVIFMSCIYGMNNEQAMRYFHIVSDNAYNTVSVDAVPGEDSTVLNINRSPSSKISSDPANRFAYLTFIEKNLIDPLARDADAPLNILVLGAGGFTLELNDMTNHYTFVDIDSALKTVSENDFLKQKLTPNKQFIVASARAFVHGSGQTYDLILLDTYTNSQSVPMETTTREYLVEVSRLLKEDGILVANMIMSPNFGDAFSVRYDNTFSSVFPHHSRQWATEPYLLPDKAHHARNWRYANMLYIVYNNRFIHDNTVYTDDKNTYSLDR